jgi:DNA sulfur modification protein DndC
MDDVGRVDRVMGNVQQPTLFDDQRITMRESIELTVDSLLVHGSKHRHWAIAWSGGKDSTTLLALIVYLIESGRVPRPERLTICYADTRLELLPLAHAAQRIMGILRERGYDVRVVCAPIERRFFPYMFGRGVPPPNNYFRWCTGQLKMAPMQQEMKRLTGEAESDVLMLTGVRQGESAIRDGRIAMSCGRDGAECGQGWYQEMKSDHLATLAPILHWRVCHVWDWLMAFAPQEEYSGLPTQIIADAYGGDEATEINARTGCIGCPLTNKDTSLDCVLHFERWKYLRPLKELRPLYRWLEQPQNRLRKHGGERYADGKPVKNQYRMGPLTMDARRKGLETVLMIQERINRTAELVNMPKIDLISEEEEAFIIQQIQAGVWPNKWTGNEPRADEPFEEVGEAGQVQESLPWAEDDAEEAEYQKTMAWMDVMLGRPE